MESLGSEVLGPRAQQGLLWSLQLESPTPAYELLWDCISPTSMDGAVGPEVTASPPAPNLHPLTFCTYTSPPLTKQTCSHPPHPHSHPVSANHLVLFFSRVGGVIRQSTKSKKSESLGVANGLFTP